MSETNKEPGNGNQANKAFEIIDLKTETENLPDPFEMMKNVPRNRNEAIAADDLATRWHTTGSNTRRILNSMIAAGYVQKFEVNDESHVRFRYVRTTKAIRVGTTEDVIDFIRARNGATAGLIMKHMRLEWEEWKRIRNELAADKVIAVDEKKWRVI